MTAPNVRRSAALLAVGLALAACSTVPVTGRKRINLIPESQELALGEEAYAEVLKENQLTDNQRWTEIVKRVAARITPVTDEPGLPWEVNVIESNEMNAFCLPGGKIAFYTGILPICRNEAGVAVVMGHEIAHAIADHGTERMSQGLLAQIGAEAVGIATEGSAYQKEIMAAFGLGANYGVMLPFSRKHESEADHIGLVYMAKAGYDPEEAVRFWQRFASMKSGGAPPEWLSTHPADATRIADLQALMPDALELYRAAPKQVGLGETL
jgi:predicted Zn-dependent protease